MKPVADNRDRATVQLATFTVVGGVYAIDIMRIKEIINPLPITPVPKAPAFMEGVIDLRGDILPVVDLRKRFDLPATELTRQSKYILVSIDRKIVGLIVDGMGDLPRIAPSEIKPAPEMTGAEAAAYFKGVCHHGGRIIMVLDIDRILTSQERISLGHLAGGGQG